MATNQTNINTLKDKKILEYPIGLGASDKDAYGMEQQYVMFKINTDARAGVLRDDTKGGQVNVTQGRIGTGVGSSLFSTFDKNDDKDARLLYGDAAVDKEKWFTQKGVVKLDKVIILPMPNEHRVMTSIQYDENKSTLLTQLGDLANQSGGAVLKDLWLFGKNKGISYVMNKVKSGLTNDAAMFAEDRLALNPKKEIMFKDFDFRKFNFNYTFSPKDENESKMVFSIIETFRYYSLPEISGAKLFYIFPSEFEISFMQGQEPNPHIPKITTCVLQNITVNYMPQSVWSTLPNGSPLSLSISLDFLELELVDRSRVWNEESNITSGY